MFSFFIQGKGRPAKTKLFPAKLRLIVNSESLGGALSGCESLGNAISGCESLGDAISGCESPGGATCGV